MLSFKNLLLLFNVTFIYYPTFVKMNVEVMAENFEADFGRFETVGHVRKSATTNSEKPVNASVAAAELDILMPPIEYTEGFAGFADVTIVALKEKVSDAESGKQAPNWWHTYDAILLALGMIVMLLLMILFTHSLWRRHTEQRDLDWEAESARIFHSTPYYIDPGHLMVY